MSSTEKSTIVTLVVVFDKQQPPVRIKMDEAQAQMAVAHSTSGVCASRPFSGRDVNGQPFNVNVGDMATAVYIETESNDS
jgi:hypothetical protein